MMEFIIVLPLHLLLLFGTVYLGTIAIDRNAAVGIDHFASFVTECSLDGLCSFYAPGDDAFKVMREITPATPGEGTFLYLSKSKFTVARGLPSWLQGLRRLSTVFLKVDEKENKVLSDKVMASSNDKDALSMALIRNPRYAIDRAATTEWAAVANEPFAAGDAPTPVVQKELAEYNRNSLCEKWSVKL